MNWVDRIQKNGSREYVLDGYVQRHAAIFFPGWDEDSQQAGQDIRLALTNGQLDKSLPIYLVERDPELAKCIYDDINALGFTNIIMHVGDVSTLKLHHMVDFAFIDLMGSLNRNICDWLSTELSPKLVVDATVAVTVAYCVRSNIFMKESAVILSDHFRDYVAAVKYRYGVYGTHKLTPLLLLRACFNRHAPAYRKLMKYQDSILSMLTYKFTNFEVCEPQQPNLQSIVSKMSEKAMTHEDRISPANKAWATRRANAAAKTRSDAAKKAWNTRRATAVEPLSKGSQAALKAWETRRKNGWVHPNKISA